MCAVDFLRQNVGGISYNRTLNPDNANENGQTEGNVSIAGDGNDTSGYRYGTSSIGHYLYRNYKYYMVLCKL